MVSWHRWMTPVALLLSGCTHVQLRNNTLHQAQAVHEVHLQQVLDNLAMFTMDPDAVPFFTVVGAGTAAVSDTGSASTTLSWIKLGFESVSPTFSASRLSQENFTLAPISDPDKLARMRCAYQAAIGYPGADGQCIDCCALRSKWSQSKWTGRPDSSECIDECSPQPGWFCMGCKSDVPDSAKYVGHCHGTYVWVTPEGYDQFARLMLSILDYATAISSARVGKAQEPTPTAEEAPGAEPESVSETPLRQNFFAPSPVPQVVIPLSPMQ
jgi:hypothetical protein